MALYIKPPSGAVSFNKLHTFVMKRLAFLHYINGHSIDEITKVIERETLAENSECLIEGSAKDKISHFTLRLLCTSDNGLRDFFIQTEVKFFSYRLQFCDFSKLRQMLNKASKQSKIILSNSSYILNFYAKVLRSLIFVSEQIENNIEKSNFINVPFTSALKFVTERIYQLHLGYIYLPIKDLKSFLILLFHELLFQGINQMRITLNKELDDPRIQYMLHKVKKWLHSSLSYSSISKGKRFVHGCNLIDESKKFPLCMNTLYDQLLRHHRLKHISRIQLTLFLKEIGVPHDVVIKLFRKEYSLPLVNTCESSHGHCSHNWNDSEKRYIYSIEHLYGLRGSRKNYKAHSCETLQNTYSSDGGCPFVTFDDDHLHRTLESQNLMVKDIEDIITMVNQKKYNEACCSYLHHKFSKHHQEEVKKNFHTSVSNSNCVLILESLQDNHSSTSLPKTFNNPSDFYLYLSSFVD